MFSNGIRKGDKAKLEKVQAAMQRLIDTRPEVEVAVLQAFDDFKGLHRRYWDAHDAIEQQVRLAVRDLLRQGKVKLDSIPEFVVPRIFHLHTAAPRQLAAKACLEELIPEELRAEFFQIALHAIDAQIAAAEPRRSGGTSPEPAAATRLSPPHGDLADLHRIFRVVIPETGELPPDPTSPDLEELQRFEESELLTIALHRLGGLAAHGSLPKALPKNLYNGDIMHDVPVLARVRARYEAHGDDASNLAAGSLPAETAEAFMRVIERCLIRLGQHEQSSGR
jgi:hypothetical protein